MFDKTYVGQDVLGSFSAPAALDSWSKVIVNVDDDTSYEAGNDTGRTMTVTIPYGTQQMAQDILARLRGQSYQPYDASTALLDPAAELGDAVEVRGVYGGLYKRDRTLGKLYSADIAAPGDEEIDHEYPYQSSQTRQIVRQRRQTKASLQVLTDRISLEVSAREETARELTAAITVQADRITQEVTDRQNATEALSSQITQQAGEISAKVSKNGGGSSFSWSLLDSYMAWYANGSEIVRFDSSGAAIKGRIEALSGKIGGFDIQSNYLSYNGQTWGGTNTWGIYIGPEGIQLGNSFKVDSAGNLSAASGTFTGAVLAGSIQYGGWAGTLDGAGLTSNSVAGGYGGPIQSGTVSTSTLTSGVNTSLGYANFAKDVFNGISSATYVKCEWMLMGRYRLGPMNLYYTNSQGEPATAVVIGAF